jgi:hypothetical protein
MGGDAHTVGADRDAPAGTLPSQTPHNPIKGHRPSSVRRLNADPTMLAALVSAPGMRWP